MREVITIYEVTEDENGTWVSPEYSFRCDVLPSLSMNVCDRELVSTSLAPLQLRISCCCRVVEPRLTVKSAAVRKVQAALLVFGVRQDPHTSHPPLPAGLLAGPPAILAQPPTAPLTRARCLVSSRDSITSGPTGTGTTARRSLVSTTPRPGQVRRPQARNLQAARRLPAWLSSPHLPHALVYEHTRASTHKHAHNLHLAALACRLLLPGCHHNAPHRH